MSQKASGIELLVRYKVLSKDGAVIFDSGQKQAKCFTRNFAIFLHNLLVGAQLTATDINGVSSYAIPFFYDDYSWYYGLPDLNSGKTNEGIVVGTDNTAVDPTDYALGSQIAHGTGAGNFEYGACVLAKPLVASGNVDFVISRSFANSSGGSITVEEVGIYGYLLLAYGPGGRYYCFVRDVTEGISVSNGDTFVVEYTWRTTV